MEALSRSYEIYIIKLKRKDKRIHERKITSGRTPGGRVQLRDFDTKFAPSVRPPRRIDRGRRGTSESQTMGGNFCAVNTPHAEYEISPVGGHSDSEHGARARDSK
ncbi:hypothetical protein EVAR_100880_1 [Eumeta japonica]|uniref:Uncharacterized protein n=1 Tax=Eumeta variegata TaxID=151549 RepID=A0A4C1SB10_EUMVA|nr:hypothetical protein EVAR_100880_1 [Eumeta japonica]